MVGQILLWYLVVQFFSLAGFPLTFAWLRRLPSRGYGAAKALGILLSGVLLWWGGTMHLWGNTASAAISIALVLFGAGIWLLRGQWSEVLAWWHKHRGFVLTAEILFIIAFVFWALVRAAQPQLETAGGEKWMEIGFLNAVLRSNQFPPLDPWLSGFAISYYYLGYVLLGMLTRVAGLPATIAFNLGNASWFALAAIGAYGIVYDLLQGRSTQKALLGPLILLLTGNGEGFLEVLHARGLLSGRFWVWLDIRNLNQAPEPPFSWVPQRFFWWWQASRTLQDYAPWGARLEVIDEFPAFSFILGDMHPHVLALPFVLVVVALALNTYLEQLVLMPGDSSWSFKSFLANLRLPLIGTAVVLGALGFLNTWDFPIYWALWAGALVLGRYRNTIRGTGHAQFFDVLWSVFPEAVFLGILSVLAYLPFWVGLRSQAGGVVPNLFNATRLPHFIVMFLPLLVPLLGILIKVICQTRIHWVQVFLWAIALIVVIALVGGFMGLVAGYPYIDAVLKGQPIPGMDVPAETFLQALVSRLFNPWTALLLASGVAIAVLSLLSAEQGRDLDDGIVFPLLLALIGLLLTLAPEFVFLRDIFGTRMNTIFKFYFQAWVLWSLSAAWQIAVWIERPSPSSQSGTARKPVGVSVGAVVSLLLVVIGMLYTGLAIPTRAHEHGVPWTLDGTAWMQDAQVGDWAAISWLNANITGAPVIVETPGDSHRAYVYEGRVSALTGLPTVLGWAGHENQWRGTYDEQMQREYDLELLYTTLDMQLTRDILQRYNVEYIYIGPTERQRYTAGGLEKFATGSLFSIVYDRLGVVIYRVEL